jgi:SAM-dependent methyltransferase
MARGKSAVLETIVFFLVTLIGLTMVWLGKDRTKTQPRPVNPLTIHDLLDGYRSTALLYLTAKLGIADLLANGPRSSSELTEVLGAHEPYLHRVLRGLAAFGVCKESPEGLFELTGLGRSLQTGKPDSLRGLAILCGEEFTSAWLGLVHSVMSGETAFDHVFGMSQWEHRKQHTVLDHNFNVWLKSMANRVAVDLLKVHDFSPYHVILDAGGGHGALIAAILKAHPAATGILFDQPHVIAGALPLVEAEGIVSRCRIVGGSFFEGIPGGIDACILKSVIHDWDDERSLAILKNCRKALNENGKLLLIEHVLPAGVDNDPRVILIDLHMMAVTGGRERTEDEFRALCEAAGFIIVSMIPIKYGYKLIEARIER